MTRDQKDNIENLRIKLEKMFALAVYSAECGHEVMFDQTKENVDISIKIPVLFEEKWAYGKREIKSLK